jgi:P pilus assembly chaperone PapD
VQTLTHSSTRAFLLAAALAAALAVLPASAGIVLSQAVVDILPSGAIAQDIDIWNDGTEVAYVTVEPAEIVSPGQSAEVRTPITDPGIGGLLVTPQRLILQPGEHKLIRIAAIVPRGATDRIYRVAVKPVAGPVSAPVTALKLLVGYDVLVIYRPAQPTVNIVGERNGNLLTLRNAGNSNVEIYEGKQCDPARPTVCVTLPAKRLYAGQVWQQALTMAGPVDYRIAQGPKSVQQRF